MNLSVKIHDDKLRASKYHELESDTHAHRTERMRRMHALAAVPTKGLNIVKVGELHSSFRRKRAFFQGLKIPGSCSE